MSTPVAYWVAVCIGAAACGLASLGARRWPGPWVSVLGRVVGALLALDAVVFLTAPLVDGRWSVQTSLPLALCDVTLVVAVVACWWPDWALGVELTYFWGLTGTLQAVITPDLHAGFPRLEFFEFVVGHLGIVVAAVYLVVGRRRTPRPRAVPRVLAITVAYAAVVGVFDALTGSDYMFLAAPPANASLLSVLGPWPWYLVSAAAVGFALLVLLDAPFHRKARRVPHTLARW